jgi:DNA ligase-1
VDIGSRAELDAYQADCVARGYEGAILRNPTGEYEHKRSANLLKVKQFVDEEFLVTSVNEGAGKLMNSVGAFVLVTKKGVEFKAKPMGTLEQSQAYWKDRAKLVGRQATVKFFGYTPEGSIRFPVLKCFVD